MNSTKINTTSEIPTGTTQHLADNSMDSINMPNMSMFNTAYLLLFILVMLYAINKAFVITILYFSKAARRRKYLRLVKGEEGQLEVLTFDKNGIPTLLKFKQKDGKNSYRFI